MLQVAPLRLSELLPPHNQSRSHNSLLDQQGKTNLADSVHAQKTAMLYQLIAIIVHV